jgi:hypothetical protein
MTLTRQRTCSVVAGMLLVAFAIALFAAGHGKAAITPTPPPAPEVSVIYVQGEDVATYREYPGLDSYLQVLDAQRNLFRSELDLTTLQRQELTSIVELYRALRGGWNQ